MTTDVTRIKWQVAARKQIDYPIVCFDEEGNRIVVARVPFSKKMDADKVAALISTAPRLLSALQMLKQAIEFTPLGIPALVALKAATDVINDATGVQS